MTSFASRRAARTDRCGHRPWCKSGRQAGCRTCGDWAYCRTTLRSKRYCFGL